MPPLHDQSPLESVENSPSGLVAAYVEGLKENLSEEIWTVKPRILSPDQVHEFRRYFGELDEVAFRVEMHLHILFDWISRDVFDWLVKVMVVISIQRQRIRASHFKQTPCFIMSPRTTSTLVDMLELYPPIIAGIIHWTSGLKEVYELAEADAPPEDGCTSFHRWLQDRTAVPEDILADLLGCPCLARENRVLSTVPHLPLPAASPSSPTLRNAKELPPLLLLDAPPSRKRSVDVRTPSTATFAPPAAPKRSCLACEPARRASWASSVGTLVDEREFELPEKGDTAMDEDSDRELLPALSRSGDREEVCSDVVSDDATVISEDGEETDSGCCVSPCFSYWSMEDEDALEADSGTSHSADSDSRHNCQCADNSEELVHTPKLHKQTNRPPYEDIQSSTRLPFWSRLFRLVLPSWSTL